MPDVLESAGARLSLTPPCGRELAHEDGISVAESLVDVPAPSRARWIATPVAPTNYLSVDTSAASSDTALYCIKHIPCGSELAHEDGISAAESWVDVPTPSRASSLPPVGCRQIHLRRLLTPRFLASNTSLAHEDGISAAEFIADVPGPSRASSLPQNYLSVDTSAASSDTALSCIKHISGGSELAHEDSISSAEFIADVPAHLRASSLPPVGCRQIHLRRLLTPRFLASNTFLVGVSLLTKAAFQPLNL